MEFKVAVAVLLASLVLQHLFLETTQAKPLLRRELQNDERPMMVLYYTNYRGTVFQPTDVDFNVVTHVMYAFYGISYECELAVINPNSSVDDEGKIFPELGMASGPEYTGPRGYIGAFRLLKDILAAKGLPGFKLMLSIGGWHYSSNYSRCTSTQSNRNIFLESIRSFMSDKELDGIDFNWQFPGGGADWNDSSPDDYENYLKLIREAREMMETSFTEKKYISVLQGMSPDLIEGVDGRLCDDLDYLMLKSYDYNGAWNENFLKTGISAGLYADGGEGETDSRYNVNWSVNAVAAVCPLNKMVLGVPCYARCWAGVNPENNGLFQPSEGPCQGLWNSKDSVPFFIMYGRETKQYTGYNSYFDYYWNENAMSPYMFNPTADPNYPTYPYVNVFITYDNERSVGIKAGYAKGKGMAGMYFFDGVDDKIMEEEGIEMVPGYSMKKYRLQSSAADSWVASAGPTTTSTVVPTSTTTSTVVPTSTTFSTEKWEEIFRQFTRFYLQSFNLDEHFDRFIDHFMKKELR